MFDFEDEQFRVRMVAAELPGACGTLRIWHTSQCCLYCGDSCNCWSSGVSYDGRDWLVLSNVSKQEVAQHIGQELVPPNSQQNEWETKFGSPKLFREESILQMTEYPKKEQIT